MKILSKKIYLEVQQSPQIVTPVSFELFPAIDY